jgi:Protein kinase domain
MSLTSYSNEGIPGADQPRRQVPDQPTVLLSDAPTVSTSTVQPVDAANLSAAPVQPIVLPTLLATLSAAALAALSQRYDILAEAGHGSMGNVYKARDRETGETVALKLLKPEIASDQAMMDRFKNELLFARKITHKNICRVHEFNRLGGIAYTSMEFVEGESLRSVLNRFGGLSPRKVIDLAQQMCSGLKEAHAQGIVHRDLKPENVMIDAQGNVKIMDFGIARSMDVATRLTGSMVGTPAYMAPEQVAGKPVDYRTDIYSLGLILYEMFTGAPAFQADNAVAVALKQMQENPRPPREIEPNIPAAMERAVLKCLEKDPVRRFQSAAELESAIRLPVAPAPSVTRPSPIIDASAAPVRRDIPIPQFSPLGSIMGAPPRRSRSAAGTFFAWVLLWAALGFAGYAGWHWLAPVAWPDAFSFPDAPPVPKIPDFALESTPLQDSAPQATAPASPVIQEAATVPDGAAKATKAASTALNDVPEVSPASPATQAKNTGDAAPAQLALPRNQSSAREAAPAPGQPRAGKSTVDGSTEAVNAMLSGMIWVGRYERRDRADVAAKEIQDLGLPAMVIARNGALGEFFVVMTGPFMGKKLADTAALLQADGFANARPVQSMEGNSFLKPNSNQSRSRNADQ